MRKLVWAPALAGLVLAAALANAAGGPVGWRGDGTGAFPGAKPPSEWSASKNVLWKAPLPGFSYSAPVVVGDRVFVASDPGELLCLNRADGKELWRKAVKDIEAPRGGGGFGRGGGGRGGFGRGGRGGGMGGLGGRSAGNTAATPVTDGTHIAAVFGNGVVAVYDTSGKRLWGKGVEASRVMFGHSASPLLVGGKVIVHFNDMVALDLKTGKEVWRAKLPASHASPVSARLGGEDFIVSPSGHIVRAADGQVVAKGDFRSSDNSPVVVGDTVFVLRSGAFKLSRDKEGKVTTSTLWAVEGGGGGGGGGRGGFGRGGGRGDRKLPSPVVHDGLVYGVGTDGFLEVKDAKSGKQAYRQRLPLSQVYSSVTLAGGLLYVFDLRGKAVVFKPGRKFERVAINDLVGTGSCPTFAGDQMFVRGERALYCVGTRAKD